MGKRGTLRRAKKKSPRTSPRKKTVKKSKSAKLITRTAMRKFRAVKREVDVYVKKRTQTYTRAKRLKNRNLSDTSKEFIKNGQEFFGSLKGRKRKAVNARITLQFKTKDGNMQTRVINRRRLRTSNPATFKRRLKQLISDASRSIKKYDARKSVTAVYVKGFTFEVKDREEKIKKKPARANAAKGRRTTRR